MKSKSIIFNISCSFIMSFSSSTESLSPFSAKKRILMSSQTGFTSSFYSINSESLWSGSWVLLHSETSASLFVFETALRFTFYDFLRIANGAPENFCSSWSFVSFNLLVALVGCLWWCLCFPNMQRLILMIYWWISLENILRA